MAVCSMLSNATKADEFKTSLALLFKRMEIGAFLKKYFWEGKQVHPLGSVVVVLDFRTNIGQESC